MTRYAPLPCTSPRRVAADPADIGAALTPARKLRRRPPAGLVIGGDPDRGIATLPLGMHSITYGASGAGKTMSVAVPSLAATMASRERPHLLIVDVKETLWAQTAGWADAHGYRVRRIDLRSTRTPDAYNPLEPAWRAWRRGDMKRSEELADDLCAALEATVNDSSDLYWQKAATRLFKALFAGLCDVSDEPPTFDAIAEKAFAGKEEQLEFISHARKSVAKRLEQAMNLNIAGVERTWSCVLDVLDSMCGFYLGPVGRAVAGESTFDPALELLADEPLALYVTVPDDSDAAMGYVSLLIDSTYRRYVHDFELRGLERRRTRPVMCVIDEAARIPRCGLTSIMAAGRSRRFYVHLFMQSFSQFLEKNRYTREEADVLVEQAEVSVYLATASERIGADLKLKSAGLLDASDLVRLRRGEAIVARTGRPVVRTELAPIDRYRDLGLFDLIDPPDLSRERDDPGRLR